LGEKALDRSGQVQTLYPPTTTAALMETSRRTGVDAGDIFFRACVKISASKYRSVRRKDQLEAVARLLVAAALLFPDRAEDTLEKWGAFLLCAFHVSVWCFPTAYPQTPMQRAPP